MKIEALPSVIFATLVIDLRIWLATVFLVVLFVPTITHAKVKPNVAVVYFDNNSGDSKLDSLSKGFADMLITDLSSSGQVTVVEREKLQALLDETKLQESRFFDPKTAVRIGKGLGASHVVAGAFIASSPKMRVDVRLIEIATGKVILSTKVQGASNDIFKLEQDLVAKFLEELDLKFFPAELPATKVPNLKTLISYSVGLGLVDHGKDAQAALQLKSVVKMAPAFALARIRHSEILTRLENAKSQRSDVLQQGAKTLYAHARAHIKATGGAVHTEEDASLLLGYQVILRHEASVALHAALVGRSAQSRLVPKKGSARAGRAMQSYFKIQKQLVDSNTGIRKQFPAANPSFKLSKDDEALARELEIEYRDDNNLTTLLRFLLEGRVESSGRLESFSMSPAPSDIDNKLKKAALKYADRAIKNAVHLPAHSIARAAVNAHELLAKWHIQRERIEEGVAEYQKILDAYPSLHRWDFYERQIHMQLGIKHEHLASKRRQYKQALKTCDASKINASQGPILASRIHSRGMLALSDMLQEVTRACSKSPAFPRIEKSLLRVLASRAGHIDDCDALDTYEARWIKLGGSANSAVLYRKRYACK